MELDNKTLIKVIVFLLLLLQALGGVIVNNVYSRFVSLEEENRLYDDRLDELNAKVGILESRVYTLMQLFDLKDD